MNQMNSQYFINQTKSSLKEGDSVMFISEPKSYEKGWQHTYDPHAKHYLNRVGKVVWVYGSTGLHIKFKMIKSVNEYGDTIEINKFWLPYFSLHKIDGNEEHIKLIKNTVNI